MGSPQTESCQTSGGFGGVPVPRMNSLTWFRIQKLLERGQSDNRLSRPAFERNGMTAGSRSQTFEPRRRDVVQELGILLR